MAPVQIPDVVLFTPGRACAGPLAIVLHEWHSGIESLDAAMQFCPRRRPAQSPGCHTSYHYGIGGSCQFHQYIDNADTAWGFGLSPVTCPTPPCPPDACSLCTGLTADQYNPDLDGNPPVLPVWAVGPDGTVNCAVKHVAVTNLFPTNQSLGSGPCCLPDAKAYRCLVESLCYIFQTADIVPSQSTLLVHCNELICLDIDQLVEDILACINTPPPPGLPCNCAPTAEQFCATLATLPVSQSPTLLVLGDDCQFHPTADAFNVVAADTPSIDTTVVEAPPNTFTISADAIISPDAGNSLSIHANGLYANRGELIVAPILNAGVIDPTSGTDVYVYSSVGVGAATLVDPVAGEKNDLWIKNISASVFSVAAASLIDGVGVIALDGTVPAGYPFGNNGGEAVHLVYDFANTTWYVL
jgi:hypothetical protein